MQYVSLVLTYLGSNIKSMYMGNLKVVCTNKLAILFSKSLEILYKVSVVMEVLTLNGTMALAILVVILVRTCDKVLMSMNFHIVHIRFFHVIKLQMHTDTFISRKCNLMFLIYVIMHNSLNNGNVWLL